MTDCSAGFSLVSLGFCDIEVPAAPFGQFMGFGQFMNPLALWVVGCTYTLASPTGRWFSGVTAAGGTPTSELPWLLTNLTTV